MADGWWVDADQVSEMGWEEPWIQYELQPAIAQLPWKNDLIIDYSSKKKTQQLIYLTDYLIN